jgi:tRNA A-37 threonylcarbamoyl transferase component Bud32
LLPEWFLPTSVILKERNPERADSYENEIDTYRHLRSLQGTHIPRLFGEAAIHDHERTRFQISKRPIPAILLEHVDGDPLHSLPTEELENPRLVKQLEEMYRLLTKNDVVHGDPRLHNFLRVGDKVFAIDFELSSPPGDTTNKHELETLKSEIRRRERHLQKAKSVHPCSGRVFLINGSQVTQVSESYNEQTGQGTLYPADSTA